jgi:thymidylate synthase ThyX
MTCNFRELLHIIELRTSIRAYPEMRTMMDKMITALSDVLPPIWEWGKEEQANA